MFKLSLMDYVPESSQRKIEENFEITDSTDDASALLLRDMDLTGFEFGKLLMAVGKLTPGKSGLPLEELGLRGIPVFESKDSSACAVKEMTLGVIIESLRNLSGFSSLVAENSGNIDSMSLEHFYTGHEMKGKVVSVLGLGRTSVEISNALSALGMHVIGFDPGIGIESAHKLSPDVEISVDPMTLFSDADFVVLCIENGGNTEGMIDSNMLELFKNGSVLINFTSEDAVDDASVLDAISSGKLSRYITDFPSPAIAGRKGITCYPHMAGLTEESTLSAVTSVSDSMLDFIKNGNIRNSLNFPDADLGEIKDENRICITTKGIPDPLTLATAILSDITIEDIDGGVKDDNGYALVSTKDDISGVPSIDGVTGIRILTDI